MRLFGRIGKQMWGGVAVIAVALCALLGVTAFAPSAAYADIADQAPVHHKTIKANDDGTYDLTLNVQGASEQSETGKPVDVVVVVDVSTSMNDEISKGQWPWGKSTSKMEAAKNATEILAKTLLTDANSKLPENQQIKMSVVTFGTHAQTVQNWTTSANAVNNSVPSRANDDQGTNWEGGLSIANSLSTGRDGAEKYIVFLSDGNPTFRNSKYVNHPRDYNQRYGVYGTGYSDDNGWNYGAAKDEANKRSASVGMFVVSADKSATNMKSFANDTKGTFLDGTSEENLKKAFEQIAQTIKKSASYKDVKIVDQLSSYVSGLGNNGEVVDITYKKNGSDWADAPKASVSGDKVSWDLSSEGELADGATYSITFKVKPNQKAYDAAVAKGAETELPSNNADGTKIYYKTVVKETGKDDQVSDEKSDGYEKPTIKVPVDTVTVKKEWKNTDGATLPASVTVQLKKDGQNYGDAFQLTAANNWTKDVIVPAGVGNITWSVVENAVDDYDTTYSADVTGSGTLTVTNTHKTWPVTLEGKTAIKGTKTLTGHDMTSAFDFKLAPAGDYGDKVVIAKGADTASVSGAKDGVAKDFSFGAVTFKAAGIYKFNVTEQGTAPAGYTFDTHTSVVTVEVTEQDGKLVATTSYGDGTSCVFKNSYEAKSVTVVGADNFNFTKELTGRDLKAGEFSFQIVATSNNDAPMPKTTTVTNDAEGKVTFGNITFTKAGVYTYEVSEDTSNLPGGVSAVTTGKKQIIITVTDNNKGQLEAKVEMPRDVIFKNAYKADSTEIETLTTKVIKATQDGVTPPALNAGDFRFTIGSTDGPLPAETIVTNDAAGNVTFGKITFDKAGTYHYTITESGRKAGVTNDSEAKTFTVEVKDNGDGTMTATASKPAGFVNTYTVGDVDYSVTTDVNVAKNLEGRDLTKGEFTFQLVDGDKVVDEATNDANGNVYFKALNYTASDLGEHTYKVREVKGDLGGVTYDDSEYTVKVTVSDNHDGTLSAKATSESGNITFKNTYSVNPVGYSVTEGVDVSKNLEGRDLTKGEFTFQLVDGDKVVDEATNDANGNVYFKKLTYTEAGKYTYTVREKAGTLGGVTYDTNAYEVTVTVTDNKDGSLSAEATSKSGDITFTNTYKANPAKLNSGVEVTKNLEGRDWTDADAFTFVITPKDQNNPLPSNGTTGTATKANQAVSFGEFTFNEAGTYEYTITEQGTDGEGVTYDTHEATVTVNVVDNGKGQLVATPTVANGVFYNTYKAGSATMALGAAKVLSGANLSDGQFIFQLKDSDGNVVETAKNDANGNIKFTHEFTAAGEYKFTISEFNDQQPNVSYDTKSYDVTVAVTDNGKGQLDAKVSGDGAVFNNTYTEPAKEEPKAETKKDSTPKTGDSAPIFGLCAAVAGAAGVIGLYRRSRKDGLY